MQSVRRLMILMSVLFLCAGQASADTAVREEQLMLPIKVGSHVEKIDALIVRPAHAGKFPIALIVNGSAGASPSSVRADWLSHIAHDFAHRGWLAASVVWPGYGRSTGRFIEGGGDCAHPTVDRFLDAHGKELGAALTALRKRPDVDPSTALGVGVSIGGAAMMDLAAQPGRPLTAVISLSGGIYHYTQVGSPDECPLFQADLVRNFTRFGKDNPTPTLWMYAANDPYFGPDLVAQMFAGYRSQGGNADYVALPPVGTNGHTLYLKTANILLKPHIEDFLKRNHLPAMDDSALMPLLSKLGPKDRANAEAYVQSVTEKAMAVSKTGTGLFWRFGTRSLKKAEQLALGTCRETTGQTCHLIAENTTLLKGWQDNLPLTRQ
jgi:dienelactone hydrolase